MSSFQQMRRVALAAVALGAIGMSGTAFAQNTASGTTVTNTATVNYSVNSIAQTAINANTSFVVDTVVNLNVTGVISPGQSCESPLVSTGVLRCGLGFSCEGQPGMRTCVVAQCIDGLDNNGDGRTDFPADPGCTSFADTTEATVCPGPSCPACGDGVWRPADVEHAESLVGFVLR